MPEAMSKSATSAPVIGMLGVFSVWKLDEFVFPHNALRAELLGMCDILQDMTHLGLSLQWLDIHRLLMWLQVFVAFLNNYLQFEDYVHAEAEREPAVLRFGIVTAVRRFCVNELTLEVSKFLSLLNCWSAGEILLMVSRYIREFLTRLLKYMAKEVKYHPSVLAGLPFKDETNQHPWIALCGASTDFSINARMEHSSMSTYARCLHSE